MKYAASVQRFGDGVRFISLALWVNRLCSDHVTACDCEQNGVWSHSGWSGTALLLEDAVVCACEEKKKIEEDSK